MIKEHDGGIVGFRKEVGGPERHGTPRVRAVVLAGDDDDLGVRGQLQDVLEGAEALGDGSGFRGQTEIERHHGRLEATDLRDRFLPVGRDRDLVSVERPLHLRLQRRVVLDHQQSTARVAHAAAPISRRAGATPRR